MSDWYKKWFGKDYLSLYPHRDEDEARQAVALIREVTDRRFDRTLDLACGSGRHSRALSEFGWTVGLDLSMELLKVAISHRPGDSYVRADMRSIPFAQASFDLAVNLFTSFGYFRTEDEHVTVIRELARVIKPRGTFVLDFLNSDQVRANLVPYDEVVREGIRLRQHRKISDDGRYVEKQILVEGKEASFMERVRLYSRSDLTRMLEENDFAVTHCFGNYDGQDLTELSPRMIIFAERR